MTKAKEQNIKNKTTFAIFGVLFAVAAYVFSSLAIDSGSLWQYGLAIFCIYMTIKEIVQFFRATK